MPPMPKGDMTNIEQAAMLLYAANKAYADYITSGRNGDIQLVQDEIDRLQNAKNAAYYDLMAICESAATISPKDAQKAKIAEILAANKRLFLQQQTKKAARR